MFSCCFLSESVRKDGKGGERSGYSVSESADFNAKQGTSQLTYRNSTTKLMDRATMRRRSSNCTRLTILSVFPA